MYITTTSILPAAVQQSFTYKLLSVPVPNMIHKIPAMRKTMARNGYFRHCVPRCTAMVSFGNSGSTLPIQNLTAVDIDAKISFYGTYIILNEQVTLHSQDPVLNECAAILGVSLRQTEDQLTRDMLVSTASFINCTGGVNGDNPTEITRSDVDEVVRALLNNNAYAMKDDVGAGAHYFALCPTKLIGNLENVPGFIHKNQYPSSMNALRSEWGSIGGLRFLVSPIGSMATNASANGEDIYNILCVGMGAYACIERDCYSADFIYRPSIYDGPLGVNAYVGYRFAEAPRIANDLWVINLRCTLA